MCTPKRSILVCVAVYLGLCAFLGWMWYRVSHISPHLCQVVVDARDADRRQECDVMVDCAPILSAPVPFQLQGTSCEPAPTAVVAQIDTIDHSIVPDNQRSFYGAGAIFLTFMSQAPLCWCFCAVRALREESRSGRPSFSAHTVTVQSRSGATESAGLWTDEANTFSLEDQGDAASVNSQAQP